MVLFLYVVILNIYKRMFFILFIFYLLFLGMFIIIFVIFCFNL